MSCAKIEVKDVGKKFQHKWIFKGIDCDLQIGDCLSVRGNNGAGKSTFLKMISGHLSPNQGEILYLNKAGQKISRDDVFNEITFAAPYINLLTRLNLTECLDFYQKFKSLQAGHTTESLVQLMGLKKSAHKQLRFFSSGMLQRVKLAMAICADSAVLILDEPTTNLDDAGIAWYQKIVKDYNQNRIVMIASNAEHDFNMCNRSLSILDYKIQKFKPA